MRNNSADLWIVGFSTYREIETADALAKREQERRALEQQRVLEEQKRQEVELISKEATKEAERIAREGDGSPDDKTCQERKLSPSTSQYMKCREQLAAAAEAKHKREKAEAARRDEMQRQAEAAAAKERARVAAEAAEARRREQQAAERERARIAAAAAKARRRAQIAAQEAAEAAKSRELAEKFTAGVSKAKEQCAALGFKSGTEKFGSCVLQLTK